MKIRCSCSCFYPRIRFTLINSTSVRPLWFPSHFALTRQACTESSPGAIRNRNPLISRRLSFMVVWPHFLTTTTIIINWRSCQRAASSIIHCRSDSALQLFAALGQIPRKSINRCQNGEDFDTLGDLTKDTVNRAGPSRYGTCSGSWLHLNGRLSSWTIRFRNSIHVAVFLAGLQRWTRQETVILNGTGDEEKTTTIDCTLQE